jgi:hypothetical protein
MGEIEVNDLLMQLGNRLFPEPIAGVSMLCFRTACVLP